MTYKNSKKLALTRVQTAETHTSTRHCFLCFVTLTFDFFDPEINVLGLMMEHFNVKFGDLISSGFCDIMRINRQADRQTNAGEKPYPHDCRRLGRINICMNIVRGRSRENRLSWRRRAARITVSFKFILGGCLSGSLGFSGRYNLKWELSSWQWIRPDTSKSD